MGTQRSTRSGLGDLYIQFWTKFLRRLRTEHPDLRNEQEPWRRNYLLIMPCPLGRSQVCCRLQLSQGKDQD